MPRFAVASSTPEPFYAFFAPIVTRLWAKYMGHTPVMILCKDPLWDNAFGQFVIHSLDPTTRVYWVSPFGPYKKSTLAQTSRLLVAGDPRFADDDYVLTTDVDMLPLNKPYFHSADPKKDIHIFSADAYADITKGLKPPRYPMCYLGMSAKVWRALMNLDSKRIQDNLVAAMKGRADSWFNDEEWFMNRFQKNGGQFDTQMMVRGGFAKISMAARRLDREAWNFKPANRDLIDCHCLRPGHKHVPSLWALLKAYFNDGWFHTYMNKAAALAK